MPPRRDALTPLVQAATLLVIDAATEALSLQGLDDKNGVDVARWLELLPRWAKKLDTAVLVLDHVVKDAESRGRWATGSGPQARRPRRRGLPARGGRPGRRRADRPVPAVRVKDRHGQVRKHVTPSAGGRRWAGDLVVASLEQGAAVDAVVHPPSQTDGPFLPTVVMGRVSDALAVAGRPLSGRDVEDRVNGKAATVRQALAALVDAGHVEVAPGPHNSKQHRLVRPYPDPEESP